MTPRACKSPTENDFDNAELRIDIDVISESDTEITQEVFVGGLNSGKGKGIATSLSYVMTKRVMWHLH